MGFWVWFWDLIFDFMVVSVYFAVTFDGVDGIHCCFLFFWLCLLGFEGIEQIEVIDY